MQLVEALRYKPEGRRFDSRWGLSLQPHYGPEVDSASNRNEYQGSSLGGKDGWCVKQATLPHSCANCLKILTASTSWSPWGLARPVQG
jgi:hypothetical protein